MKTFHDWLVRGSVLFLIVAVTYFSRFPHPDYTDWATAREAVAAGPPDSIDVAVVWPHDQAQSDAFLQGVQLAVSHVNADGGVTILGEDGRIHQLPLRTHDVNEAAGSASDVVATARAIAANPDVQAVVGHRGADAIRASIIYNASGTLFISPASVSSELTRHEFPFVFAMASPADEIAKFMVDAARQEPKDIRLAIVYPSLLKKSSPPLDVPRQIQRQLQKLIESLGVNLTVDVAVATTFSRASGDSKSVVADLLRDRSRFDTALILDVLPDARSLRYDIEAAFADAGLSEKVIVDMDDLDWAREKYFYTDFTPELEQSLYAEAAALVLRSVRYSVAVLVADSMAGEPISTHLASRIHQTADESVNLLRLDLLRTFGTDRRSWIPLVAEVSRAGLDYVFVIGQGQDAVRLINELRDAGADQTFVAGPELEFELLQDSVPLSLQRRVLDASEIWNSLPKNERSRQPAVEFVAGSIHALESSEPPVSRTDLERFLAATRGTLFVVSPFDPTSMTTPVREFVRTFRSRRRTGHVDWTAASGYESILSLKEAFERSRSASPELAAAAMSVLQSENGLNGSGRFSIRRALVGSRMFRKSVASDGSVRVSQITN